MTSDIRRVVIRGGVPVPASRSGPTDKSASDSAGEDAPTDAEVAALKDQAALDAKALEKAQAEIAKLKDQLKEVRGVLSKTVKERDSAVKAQEEAEAALNAKAENGEGSDASGEKALSLD